MEKSAATDLAIVELKRLEFQIGLALEIVRTIERPRGWVFTYSSVEFLETRRDSARLAGNAPIYIRDDGKVFFVATSGPLDREIEEVESRF